MTDRPTSPTPDELTAAEACALAADLGTQLYQAQDALAFVEECCVIAERTGRTITVADVRTWLKGAQCGRQMAVDPGLVVDPAAPPVHLVTWTGPANNGEQCPRTTPDNSPTSSDTPDNLRRYRAWLAAEYDKAETADRTAVVPPELMIRPHNGIAAGIAIALHGIDCMLRETRPAHDAGPTVAECRRDDLRWPLESEGE